MFHQAFVKGLRSVGITKNVEVKNCLKFFSIEKLHYIFKIQSFIFVHSFLLGTVAGAAVLELEIPHRM